MVAGYAEPRIAAAATPRIAADGVARSYNDHFGAHHNPHKHLKINIFLKWLENCFSRQSLKPALEPAAASLNETEKWREWKS